VHYKEIKKLRNYYFLFILPLCLTFFLVLTFEKNNIYFKFNLEEEIAQYQNRLMQL